MRESSPRSAAPQARIAASQDLHRGRAFVGREDQLAEIRSVARAVRDGEPWVVLVEGAAGIGKSALLARAIAELDGFTVIRAYGAREETDLNYGLMGQLWMRLPSPAPATDQAAFAADLAQSPPPAQVGARLLKSLGELESSGPLAIVIDDLQWSDKASAQALGFVLRRLYADPVLTLLAARIGPDLMPVPAPAWGAHANESIAAAEAAPGWSWLAGRELLVRMRLGGLDMRAVREFAQLGDITLAENDAERLRAHTDGNPLYLSTVLSNLTQGTFSAAGPLPVPASLVSALDRQLSTLPADSRAVLEALAVLGTRSPLSTVGDLAGVTDPAGALDQLITKGLIRWYPNDPIAALEIPHPLQRDAVYASIRPTRRRELHAHAAEVVPRAAAWSHRVSARDQTDPELAAQLEAEGGNLVENGQLDRAASMLLWAASLSSDRADFERRTLNAALNLWLDHRMARFKTLRAQVESCAASVGRTLVLGLFLTGAGEAEPAMRAMRAAFAGAIEPGAAPEAAQFAAVAGHLLSAASTWTGDDLDQATQIARSALALSGSNLVMSLRLERTAPFTIFLQHGPAAALADMAQTAMPADPGEVTARFGHLLVLRGACRAMAGDLEAGRADLERTLALADTTPIALGNMEAHFWLAQTHYLRGGWPEAQMHAEHSIAIAAAEEVWWGHQQAYMIHSLVAGGRGQWAIAEESARQCRYWFEVMGPQRWIVFSCLAAGALAVAREDVGAALDALEPLPLLRDQPYTRTWELCWAPLLAETQIAAAALEEAGETLGRIAALTAEVALLRPALAWLTGRLAEARGDTSAADRAYAAGLAIPPRADDAPYYRARLEHAYGRLLSTLGNPKSAAELLRSAHQRLTAMDARPYLDRVDTDLAELRITLPAGRGVDLRELTDRERDVARLVADGLTNAEIAARLYLSSKTIEYHLAHIYSKLGITSRRQLRELTLAG